ncbi:unnamed protein product [Owenia fusiformis]|uniref:Uncharacterized protein n=1 Tax=Owenia fusiformis TaxID=6347 RepID=A0A8J1T4U3_OWEFU|nr:unnamed protein product [Owenia fusiformis]
MMLPEMYSIGRIAFQSVLCVTNFSCIMFLLYRKACGRCVSLMNIFIACVIYETYEVYKSLHEAGWTQNGFGSLENSTDCRNQIRIIRICSEGVLSTFMSLSFVLFAQTFNVKNGLDVNSRLYLKRFLIGQMTIMWFFIFASSYTIDLQRAGDLDSLNTTMQFFGKLGYGSMGNDKEIFWTFYMCKENVYSELPFLITDYLLVVQSIMVPSFVCLFCIIVSRRRQNMIGRCMSTSTENTDCLCTRNHAWYILKPAYVILILATVYWELIGRPVAYMEKFSTKEQAYYAWVEHFILSLALAIGMVTFCFLAKQDKRSITFTPEECVKHLNLQSQEADVIPRKEDII